MFNKIKIPDEQFKKLNQLDRIEYRQREEKINTHFGNTSGLTWFIYSFALPFFYFYVNFMLIMKLIGGDKMFSILLEAGYKIDFVFIIGLVVIFIYNIILMELKNKKLQELNSEYFKAELIKK